MRLQEVIDIAESQGKTKIVQFVHDMKRAGTKLQRYQDSQTWWPAVLCDQVKDVLSSTAVPCHSEEWGKRFLVHPTQGFKRT